MIRYLIVTFLAFSRKQSMRNQRPCGAKPNTTFYETQHDVLLIDTYVTLVIEIRSKHLKRATHVSLFLCRLMIQETRPNRPCVANAKSTSASIT